MDRLPHHVLQAALALALMYSGLVGAGAAEPSAAELKALATSGARIGSITILPGDVFDPSKPGEDLNLRVLDDVIHWDDAVRADDPQGGAAP